jgi:hypothetical protein
VAVRLFSLWGVPDDEAQAVRALLEENGIPFHETSAGLLGLATPALWVTDADQARRARRLIDVYQAERAASQRAAYERLRRAGRQRRVRDLLREHPLRFLLYLLAAAAVLYFSTAPFISI